MAVALLLVVIVDTAVTAYMVARMRHVVQRLRAVEKATVNNARVIRDVSGLEDGNE